MKVLSNQFGNLKYEIMKKIIQILVSLWVFTIILQSCQQTNASSNKNGDEPEVVSTEHLTMAVLYQQRAAEYRALCLQAFNIAKLRVDESMKQIGLSKTGAVVVDIDETVLDNSPYEAKCILENVSYPTYWDEWMNASSAKPVPGALEFLNYVQSNKMEVFYITNRKEKYRAQTLKNLQDIGFPFADNEHLLLRTDESSKKARRAKVSEKYNIVLLIGDNLNDFTEKFEKLGVEERFKLVDEIADQFGNRFIVTPNPMYGDWEGALFNYDYNLSPGEKAKLRKSNLIDF